MNAKQEPPKKTKSLGKLEPVDLRAYWDLEDRDFTPWLAHEDNLNELARAIGLDSLQLEGTEQAVGDFSADIVASDDDNVVVIENQLGKTDHDHLGKLITYASAQKAKTVVWISRELRNEHRQALDWLNHTARGEVRFFGLEIELWKIGDSNAAPKFNVVVQPTDFELPTTRGGAPPPLVEEFWQEFPEFCRAKWIIPEAGTQSRLLGDFVPAPDDRFPHQIEVPERPLPLRTPHERHGR